ncbi:MAG: 7-cyano-7-deazaguanine synthase [Burkholderiales bacterium]|nr:7-cyano-7-deazaguanine synthase [Burkholderiales bacterium]
MRPVLLMASGGLDSTTVAYQLHASGITVQPVFFDYGQHCVELEWARVNEVLPSSMVRPERIAFCDVFRGSSSRLIKEADLWHEPVVDDDLYVPYRTLLFFSVAAARAQTLGILEVYTGFINSNHAKEIDCTADFLNRLDGLSLDVGPVRFVSPFRSSSKGQVVRRAVELGVPIGRTYSCQAASAFPCGACPNCVERQKALAEAELA